MPRVDLQSDEPEMSAVRLGQRSARREQAPVVFVADDGPNGMDPFCDLGVSNLGTWQEDCANRRSGEGPCYLLLTTLSTERLEPACFRSQGNGNSANRTRHTGQQRTTTKDGKATQHWSGIVWHSRQINHFEQCSVAVGQLSPSFDAFRFR